MAEEHTTINNKINIKYQLPKKKTHLKEKNTLTRVALLLKIEMECARKETLYLLVFTRGKRFFYLKGRNHMKGKVDGMGLLKFLKFCVG